MKRVLLFLVLAMVIATGVFAQTDYKRNWVGGEVSILGAGARYEFMVTPWMSVGANVYWSTLILFADFGANVVARFYPLAGINDTWRKKPGLFIETGLGFGFHRGTVTFDNYNSYGQLQRNTDWGQTLGFQIAPAVGWRFDFGDLGGFYFSPGIRVPITIGPQKLVLGWNSSYRDKVGVGTGVVIFVGLGAGF